jgi:CRISPR-associated protein Csd1
VSVLQALDGYYGRIAARGEAEAPGWSREKISFRIDLSPEGEPVHVQDLRLENGKNLVAQVLEVPAAVKRTAGVSPNLFWDKTSYVLGRRLADPGMSTEQQSKAEKRTAEEHASFKAANLALVAGSNDEGLAAFARFLEAWTADRFDQAPFQEEMLGANVVFALDGDLEYLHQREAARRLVQSQVAPDETTRFCLVTGIEGPVARLHPAVKGVAGAQSSGAALVSFNLDAFTSYGHTQGENAPTSESAAFRYGAALNRMLDRGSGNRLARAVGDATVVFWADASAAQPKEADAADRLFGLVMEPPDDVEEAAKIRDALRVVAKGMPASLSPDLTVSPGTGFHVLGLSPNAARLSVRYWLSDTIEAFAGRLRQHEEDLAVDPTPWRRPPSVNLLLAKTTALQEKFEDIPPLLAGEVMRAILSGGLYPRSWLAAVIVRLRAGDDPSTGWHAAAIHAVLARQARYDKKETPPVSLNRDSADPAYNCGRLFATLETAQRGALGKINATIRDRYMGAASATPASIFPLLIKNAQSHLGKMRKEGRGGWIERELEEIQDKISFHDEQGYPRSLKLEAQGRFFLGYYHQRKAQFVKAGAAGEEHIEDMEGNDDE